MKTSHGYRHRALTCAPMHHGHRNRGPKQPFWLPTLSFKGNYHFSLSINGYWLVKVIHFKLMTVEVQLWVNYVSKLTSTSIS